MSEHHQNEQKNSNKNQSHQHYNYIEFKSSACLTDTNGQLDTLDYSYEDLEECDKHFEKSLELYNKLNINHVLINNNLLKNLSLNLFEFINIQTLDLSNNFLTIIPNDIYKLKNLKILIIKDNCLNDQSLPKYNHNEFKYLEIINLSGNKLTQFPNQLLNIESLKEIYLGGNKIQQLPKNFEYLTRLEVLYLGGNLLKYIPDELTQLINLKSLNLCDNNLQYLPSTLIKLKNLKHLSLHNNNLTTLPVELVKLNLIELSLRNNPLVSRFVRDLNYTVPTLLELCGRLIKTKNINYNSYNLPINLISYLNSAHCCLNPKCNGVYFTSKIEHVKFVDFCGKYRVPLMQYLCSPKCNQRVSNISTSSESDDDINDNTIDKTKLKKVLFG